MFFNSDKLYNQADTMIKTKSDENDLLQQEIQDERDIKSVEDNKEAVDKRINTIQEKIDTNNKVIEANKNILAKRKQELSLELVNNINHVKPFLTKMSTYDLFKTRYNKNAEYLNNQ
jgi:predicted  nucleic acid-binding Zn-ribbon protein